MQSEVSGRLPFLFFVFACLCLIMKICDTGTIECHCSCSFLSTQSRAVLETLCYNKISHVQLVVLAIVGDKISLFSRTEYPVFGGLTDHLELKLQLEYVYV